MPAVPQVFDRARLRRRLDRAAPAFTGVDFLKARAAADLVERLEVVLRDFPLAADLGARRGEFARALAAGSARVGMVIETDLSRPMLAGRPGPRVQADEERLPFADASFDLVASSLALHGVNDLPGVLAQVRAALKPDGLFLGALFGGATLWELRSVLLDAETEVRGGAGPRVSPFLDPGDGPRLLQRAGFALPVADVDRVTVGYPHPLALLQDLRRMGETSVLAQGAGPLGRPVLARAVELYAERHGRPDGKVAATFEIVTLTGWAPHESQPQPLEPGEGFRRRAVARKPPGEEPT
jgi:SAM-dependent methyltransferase